MPCFQQLMATRRKPPRATKRQRKLQSQMQSQIGYAQPGLVDGAALFGARQMLSFIPEMGREVDLSVTMLISKLIAGIHALTFLTSIR